MDQEALIATATRRGWMDVDGTGWEGACGRVFVCTRMGAEGVVVGGARAAQEGRGRWTREGGSAVAGLWVYE